MYRNLIIGLLLTWLLVSSTHAGERGPGRYAGVVIYDRWDTCYISSGAYLMYVSEKQKELLRPYVGRSVLIDATEVSQPINPGDGLITAFRILGDAPLGDRLPPVDGLRLMLTQESSGGNLIGFTVEIENRNSFSVPILKSELAPTVFGRKAGDDPFSPSDGLSEAKITRCNFRAHCGFPGLSFGPAGQLTSDSYWVDVERRFRPDPYTIELGGGQKLHFDFDVRISKGDYDLVVGYGGGVHEGRSLASNSISFSTDARGHAISIAESRGESSTIGHEKPNLMNLLFGNYTASSPTVFLGNL